MKLHFRIFLFLFVLGIMLKAQENPVFQPKPELKIYGNFPLSFGDNMLAKAHDGKIGWGFTTSPFSVYNFKVGFGFDYTKFNVTDASLAGNIERSELLNFYGYIAYPFRISEKFELESKAGIGGNELRQKTGNNKFGNMKGTVYLAGINLEYEIAWPFEVFAGTDYVYSRFNVKSHPDYQSFFKNGSQLNCYVGIKFNMSKKKKNPQEQED